VPATTAAAETAATSALRISFRIFPDLLALVLAGHASGDCRDSTSAW
jgi:hypothetical protein